MISADNLWVFTARSNPLGWKAPQANWERFAASILAQGVNLVVVECAYGELPFECHCPPIAPDHADRLHHVAVRTTEPNWIKENLINLGIQRFPQAKYLAWVDADILFRSAEWAVRTLRALQHHHVVQPWSHCLDLGPNSELIQTHASFCRQYFLGQPMTGKENWKWAGGRYDFPHPGYAWAMTRQAYEWVGGLFEYGVMGSGDHHMALALIDQAEQSLPGGVHPAYRDAVLRWQRRAQQHIGGRIGYVEGLIEHLFHGRKSDRGYESRWQPFVKHQFDPHEDLKRNAHGVLVFSGTKPVLRLDMHRYMHSRNEDINSL